MSSNPLRIGTDGSALKNPGPAGWAWVDKHGNYAAGSWEHSTNNIAELTAILFAIEDHPDVPLLIESDSQYAINCVTRWGRAWREDPAKAKGKKNTQLVFSILDLLDAHAHGVEFEWVRGHSQCNAHPLNTAADEICGRYAAKRRDLLHEAGHHEIDWVLRQGSQARHVR